MGHDLFAWRLKNNERSKIGALSNTDRDSLFENAPDAMLRLSATKGKDSKLYDLLHASEANKKDSGSGDIRTYPPIYAWPQPPDKGVIAFLSKKERQFWDSLLGMNTGFIILFE